MRLALKRHFTGEPCRNGHMSERRISDNRCVQCLKDTRARAPIEHKKNRQKRNKRWLESTKEMRQERAKNMSSSNSPKICPWCKVEKSTDEFGPDNRSKDGRQTTCRTCVNRRNRESRKEYSQTPEGKMFNRNAQLKCLYGITLDDYNEMLKEQDGKCAICRTDVPGGPGAFAVDHDHTTGKIRGLLCTACNRKLGIVENKEFNRLAVKYLNERGG